jgi:hypothetical protein
LKNFKKPLDISFQKWYNNPVRKKKENFLKPEWDSMKIMYKLALYGPISDAIVSESKKYYSNYYEAMAAAEKRTKLTGLIWVVKPVRLN